MFLRSSTSWCSVAKQRLDAQSLIQAISGVELEPGGRGHENAPERLLKASLGCFRVSYRGRGPPRRYSTYSAQASAAFSRASM